MPPPPDANVLEFRPVLAPLDDDAPDEAGGIVEPTGIEIIGATGKLPGEDVKMAVDPPETKLTLAELTGLDLPARRVIVPKWMKSWADFRSVVWWLLRYIAHVVTYHATRAPKYAVKSVWRSFVGSWRTLRVFLGWALDSEGRQMARAAHLKGDQQAWKTARKEWHDTVHRRLIITAVYLVVILVALVCAYVWAPPYMVALVLVVGLGVLVHVGRPEDGNRLFDEVVASGAQAWRLDSKMIRTALVALRIVGMVPSKDIPARDLIGLPAPITKDGPGWRAEIELPHGVTAAQVMEKRAELASGLRRPLGCVWPESRPDVHAGRVVLWVGDQEMSKMKPPRSPYVKEGWRGDAFAELPFGFDQRGRPIAFEMMYGNLLIGSLPGGGKTASLRALMLGLALDPTVEMRIAEHKGSGDLSMFEQFAHFYVSGVTDEDIEATVGMLRDVLREVERRAKVIKDLGKKSDLAPESKVTRQTASMRHLGLHPLVVVVDECQELFTHDDLGAEAGKLAERIIKRGRAFGVMTIWATQRPDAKSLPTGVSANVSHRFCLRVMGQVENDMILGTSSYKQGIQATTLSPRDKGIGYLKGAFDDAVVVRSYYQDKALADRIAKRAFTLREEAGRLTGMAAGEETERAPSYSLIGDLGTIFVASERMHSEDVCARLAELRPDAYEGWTPEQLAAAVKPYGLATTQVWIAPAGNRKGLKREQVMGAIEARAGLPELDRPTDQALVDSPR